MIRAADGKSSIPIGSAQLIPFATTRPPFPFSTHFSGTSPGFSSHRRDLSFAPSEPEAYRRDVPKAQVHILDAGHFALDTAADEIADLVRRFISSRQLDTIFEPAAMGTLQPEKML